MNPLELLASLLAPHLCLVCRAEGAPLCLPCADAQLEVLPPHCYRCGRPSDGSATCQECSQESALDTVWVGSVYTGVAKDLIHQLKFQRAKAGSRVIAEWLNQALPSLGSVIISPVPTANKRVRARGYDQAALIARRLARLRRLSCRETLRRSKSTRQVGAGRQERFKQLENAFAVHKPRKIDGKHILLIDDVLTTGATLESAALALKKAGAAKISAAVFARSI